MSIRKISENFFVEEIWRGGNCAIVTAFEAETFEDAMSQKKQMEIRKGENPCFFRDFRRKVAEKSKEGD